MKTNPRIDIEIFCPVSFVDFNEYAVMFIFNTIFFRTIILDDHSRIVLKNCDKSIPGSDYINANMIRVIIYLVV